MTVTVGNQFGVRQKDGATEQYIPPKVVVVNPPTIGQNQTIAAGDTLAAGDWRIVSGEFTNSGTTSATVAPIVTT